MTFVRGSRDQLRREEWLQCGHTSHRISFIRLESCRSEASDCRLWVPVRPPTSRSSPRPGVPTCVTGCIGVSPNATAIAGAAVGPWLSAAAVLVMSIAGSVCSCSVDRSRGDSLLRLPLADSNGFPGRWALQVIPTRTRIRVSLRSAEQDMSTWSAAKRSSSFANDRSSVHSCFRGGQHSVIAVVTFSVRRQSHVRACGRSPGGR